MSGPAVHEGRLGVTTTAGEHLVEPLAATVMDVDILIRGLVLGLQVLVVLVAPVQV